MLESIEDTTIVGCIQNSDVGTNSPEKIKKILTRMTEKLSLNMESVELLIKTINENKLGQGEEFQSLLKKLTQTNREGVDLYTAFNAFLSYIYTFDGLDIDSVLDLRKNDVSTILGAIKRAA